MVKPPSEPRDFKCKETGEPCLDGRCTRGFCFEYEKQQEGAARIRQERIDGIERAREWQRRWPNGI